MCLGWGPVTNISLEMLGASQSNSKVNDVMDDNNLNIQVRS